MTKTTKTLKILGIVLASIVLLACIVVLVVLFSLYGYQDIAVAHEDNSSVQLSLGSVLASSNMYYTFQLDGGSVGDSATENGVLTDNIVFGVYDEDKFLALALASPYYSHTSNGTMVFEVDGYIFELEDMGWYLLNLKPYNPQYQLRSVSQ